MKFSKLVWREVDRVELLPTLFQLRREEYPNIFLEKLPRIEDSRVRLALPEQLGDRNCPLVVVSDSYINEFFAWLYTFAEAVMPLSMHCKVLKKSDYDDFVGSPDAPQFPPSFRRWSSVIAGEIMFRSGTEEVLSEAATSWALLSYSFAAALAYNSYGESSPPLLDLFLSRLKSLPSSESSRGDHVLSLETIWNICHRSQRFSHHPSEAIAFTFQLLIDAPGEYKHTLNTNLHLQKLVLEVIQGDHFASDSMERRVLAFDKLATAVHGTDGSSSLLGGFGIAAAAFLVGRGTSHIHLLDGQENKFSYLWLSLFAGLCGEDYWDPKWLLITRKIEALAEFHSNSHPFKSTLTDLSWEEYYWISRSRDATRQFKALPKISPHMVTIEIVPGVPLQMRLGRPDRGGLQQPTKSSPEEESNIAVAAKLEEIARELRKRVGSSITQRGTNQPELGLGDSAEEKRARKGKK